MGIRPVSRIASVTIALIFFFAALPLQAQPDSCESALATKWVEIEKTF